MKLLYIIFCILICIPLHSQVHLHNGRVIKVSDKTPWKNVDSLRQRLFNPNQLLETKNVGTPGVHSKVIHFPKKHKSSFVNCDGYFCILNCINAVDSVRGNKNPICANNTTTLTAYGLSGTNAVVTWWTGRGGTGTKLGTGTTLPNRGAGLYYATITGQCGVASEDSVRIDSLPGGSDTTASVCNSFTWHGITYYHTGDKIYTTTNASGCDSVVTLHLTILSIPNTFTKSDAVCYGSATGSITIEPTGGVGPFTYRIGTVGPITAASGNFNNLKPGIYRAYVQDATGCIGVAAPITISQPAKVNATVIPTPVAGCNGGTNGKLTITNPVGISPFKYRLGSAVSYTPFNAPFDIAGLKAGNYIVYIQDNNSCIGSTGSVAVTQPAAVTVSFAKTDITCNTPTGSISLGAPGSANATFRIAPGSSSYTANNTFTNLAAGTYYGYAKDANGCTGRGGPIVLSPAMGCGSPFAKESSTLEAANGQLRVSLSPNPSANSFNLVVHSSNLRQPVSIRVMDATGRSMYETKGLPGQAFRFGEQLLAGVYLVEIKQGDEVRIMKAVKN